MDTVCSEPTGLTIRPRTICMRSDKNLVLHVLNLLADQMFNSGSIRASVVSSLIQRGFAVAFAIQLRPTRAPVDGAWPCWRSLTFTPTCRALPAASRPVRPQRAAPFRGRPPVVPQKSIFSGRKLLPRMAYCLFSRLCASKLKLEGSGNPMTAAT
jgi:hypothetical protein